VLLACGFKIVRLPLGVYDSFAAAGVDVRCVAPRAVIDFFARFQNGSCHCGLPVLPADVATTPFGSNVAGLKVVHDYCSQVRTIHPFQRFIAQTIHTHTHPFNGPLSGTIRVSRYRKGKTNRDLTEARDSEWQWHHLGRVQVCTSLQTDNHASTPSLSFLQAGCPSCRTTDSVKALKANDRCCLNFGKLENLSPPWRREDMPIRRIYVRPLTGPQSAHLWWSAVAKLQAANVPIA